MNITVLGSGCKKCHKTQEIIEAVVKEKGLSVPVALDTNPATAMKHNVMRTPAVVIDDEVVHFGGVPSESDVQSWFSSL